jgi:CspA family cold shock protein
MSRQVGKVKWFNDAKGFGFIAGESNQDVFVHHTAIIAQGRRTLLDGEEVEYDCEMSERGLKATNVRRLNPPVASQPTPASNNKFMPRESRTRSAGDTMNA